MWTWIICVTIILIFVGSGILYSIFAPKHKMNGKKDTVTSNKNVFVNNKGTSMDERKIYTIPYMDFDL